MTPSIFAKRSVSIACAIALFLVYRSPYYHSRPGQTFEPVGNIWSILHSLVGRNCTVFILHLYFFAGIAVMRQSTDCPSLPYSLVWAGASSS